MNYYYSQLRPTTACRLRRIRASAQSQRVYEINANKFCIIIKLKKNGWPSASRRTLYETWQNVIFTK